MSWVGLDIGGAHLKAADGRGFAASRYFPLWQRPGELPVALSALLAECPAADRLAVTMTGELADCFTTKAEGVGAIVSAVRSLRADVRVYLTDGRLADCDTALSNPLLAAASNWHVLARFAGRWAPRGLALVFDLGSTTFDCIPLVEGVPTARGKTDPERLLAGELVYSGVVRSPICAVVSEIPYRGRSCRVAQELFATTWDAYLVTGDLPEEPDVTHTADGRPATIGCAHDRLARMICADRTLFTRADALAAARAVRESQLRLFEAAIRQVLDGRSSAPETVILCGQGEFLLKALIERVEWTSRSISLDSLLGPHVSRCATAHALAVVASEFPAGTIA